MERTDQASLDAHNARFWDELCGTGRAQLIGVTDSSTESLARFDRAYLDYYPYLGNHLPPVSSRASESLLEIGLGYGTLGQLMAERGYDYSGLDIAEGPVKVMRERLERTGVSNVDARVICGSALDIPFADESFDRVMSIGCLHHTGDIAKAVQEVLRVLRPSGVATIMLYNLHSLRQVNARTRARLSRRRIGKDDFEERLRAVYDTNRVEDAAPATQFLSKRDCQSLFSGFSSVEVKRENLDPIQLWPKWVVVPRERLLSNLGRLVGLDLYISAVK